MNLFDLPLNTPAIIKECICDEMCVKIYEMGLIPGEIIIVDKASPLGDPIQIHIDNNVLIIRKREAQCIIVNPL